MQSFIVVVSLVSLVFSLVLNIIYAIIDSRPLKIKVGIRFSFDTLYIGIEENLVLHQEVA